MVKRLPKINKEMKVQELIDIEKKYKERHNSVHLKLNQVNESVPDNNLVHEKGTVVPIDFDGMYVPAMKGQKTRVFPV